MNTLELLFDILLGITLLWLSWQVLFNHRLYNALLSFIGLGMLMAVAWIRLGAPDLALAEAALGGGVTGALLLAALKRLEPAEPDEGSIAEGFRPLAILCATLLIAAVGGVLIWVLLSLPSEAQGLSAQVREHLPKSGVRAEVTAVLLNFRGYDTLLELAVLFAAALGAWHLDTLYLPKSRMEPAPVLNSLVRVLVPVTILVAGYVLWLGEHTAGGAFQAGALLAGAGVLILVTRPEAIVLRNSLSMRLLLIAGSMVFTLVAGAVMFPSGSLLEYPTEYAGGLILFIEAASTLSIGVTLALLFAGGRPHRGGGE